MALIFSSLTACSGDDGGGDGGGSNMATYIKAKVDGQAFTTFETNGFLSAIAEKDGDAIYVIGSATDGTAMTITLTGITAPGTYVIDGTEGNNGIAYVANDVAYSSITTCENHEGSVTITTINDTKIEGSFSFTGNKNDCSGSKSITNGKFRGTF